MNSKELAKKLRDCFINRNIFEDRNKPTFMVFPERFYRIIAELEATSMEGKEG